MADINHDWKVFKVSDEIMAAYPELVKLVTETGSMDDDEKQYWFDILPSMTDNQVDRLFNILDTEKKKLEALEDKYQKEIKNLNEKHLIEWQEYKMKDSKEKIKAAQANEADDDADDVLKMLNDL